MLKKKGFTLIEVIVSIAIIGLIALAFLPSLSNNYKWIVDTETNITDKAFAAQETMEDNVSFIKSFMSNPSFSGDIDLTDYASMGITKKITNVELFNTQYPLATYADRQFPNAYQTEANLSDNRIFKTWVSDKRIPVLAVPEIEVKSFLLSRNGSEIGPNFEYYNYSDLKIQVKSNMLKNPQNSFNRYRNDWYVSKPGFMIPVQSIAYINEDVDFGRIYPDFPEDYLAVPFLSNLGSNYSYVSMDERNIEVVLANSYVLKYPGKYILYTITPFAKSLKKGITSEVKFPIYIYGPDFTENLVVHLDASSIDLSDKYDASSNPSGSIVVGNDRFRRWKNNRPSILTSNSSNDAIQTNEVDMPVLKKTDIAGAWFPEIAFQNIDGEDKVWGRSLANLVNIENKRSKMEIADIDLQDKMSIFMIIRRVENPYAAQVGSILSGRGDDPWSIAWVDDLGVLKLGFNSTNDSLVLDESLNLDQWYLIRATINGSKKEIKAINLTNGVDQILINDSSSDEIETDRIDINWNGIELSEILVYNDNISSSDLLEIEDYLKNKYNP